jgi:hypothetical protein
MSAKSNSAEYRRRYYLANKKKVNEQSERWKRANPEKVAETQRRYREANKEKKAEVMRRWRKANPERSAELKRRYREANKEQIDARDRRYREANKEKVAAQRRRSWLRKYGITVEDYDRMLTAQGGVCAICGGPPNGAGKANGRLNVDHDHDTGAVRGLLCSECNAGLGMLQDDAELLQLAAAYVTAAKLAQAELNEEAA